MKRGLCSYALLILGSFFVMVSSVGALSSWRDLSFSLDKGQSLQIGAMGDLTWSGKKNSLIARKKAFFTQGEQRVDADIIVFFFKGDYSLLQEGVSSLELSSMEASGEVHIQSSNGRATAQRAHYDAESLALTLYGGESEEVWLYFSDRNFELTAQKSFFYDDANGKAYGNGGTSLKNDRFTLWSDEVTAYMEGEDHRSITGLRADGNVMLQSPKGSLLGHYGVYDTVANVVTMSGDVRLVSGDKEFKGDYGIFDLTSGVSRLVSLTEAGNFKATHKAPIKKASETRMAVEGEEEKSVEPKQKRPSAVIGVRPSEFK